MARSNTEQDFWNKVDKTSHSGGCWTWSKCKIKGYGSFWYKGKAYYTHRLAMIFSGYDLKDLDVLHRCDNPSCVNPEHLFLGTHTDNMRDMISKGRYIHPPTAGVPKKFNADQIRSIRSSAKSHTECAKEFNTSSRHIRMIRQRKSYKDVV